MALRDPAPWNERVRPIRPRVVPRLPAGSRALSRLIRFCLLPPLLALCVLAFGAALQVSFGASASKFVHRYTDLALPKAPVMPETTYLYDRNGRLITTLHAAVNRTEVPLSQISLNLQHAVIAVEDRNFYHEGAISLTSMLRAAMVDLGQGSVSQGGSTITQQYVKNAYTGDEQTIGRKIREAVLAQKLSHRYSKDQILELYLNSIYFGEGAYGAEAAAQTYFARHASALTVGQAALVAGLIQAPASYDPREHPDAAKARRNQVLADLAAQGYIAPDLADRFSSRGLGLHKHRSGPVPAAYFVDYVSRTLQGQFGVQDTFNGGLQVSTTLDWNDQKAAEQAIASHLKSPHDPSAALVAIDPRSGDILAMVGGRDFTRAKFNLATQARRQTGSAAKPFTLAAAMEQRIDPYSIWSGPPSLTINDPRCLSPQGAPWKVSNFADESAGTMTLVQATAHSVNTIFAQLVLAVDPPNVVKVAHALGIRSHLSAVCSITLGSQSVTPLEMTDAYATFAARGLHHSPQALSMVKGSSGQVLQKASTKGNRALSQNDADLVTFALQGVIQSGTGTAANIGRPAAGKTGTAQNFQDAWFCGYVPQLAACVWVGYPRTEDKPMLNVEGFPDVFGGSIPAEIWHDFMAKATGGMKVADFHPPSFAGYAVQPHGSVPTPTPSPTPSPVPTPSPSPTCHRKHCHRP